jgi:hypothetical protein
MLSFKDFTPVQYTDGETEMQDRYAFKRHHGVVGEEAPAEEKPMDPKLAARLDKARGQEMVKAHHKKLGPDPLSPGQLKKKNESTTTIEKIRERMEANGIRRPRRIKR